MTRTRVATLACALCAAGAAAADTDKPAAKAPTQPAQPMQAAAPQAYQATPPVIGLGSPAVNAPGGLASAAAAPTHLIEIAGYVILQGAWIQEDPQQLSIGRNNGFTLGDARIEITGHPIEQLWLYLSIDGAVPLRTGSEPLAGRRSVDLKDAYGVYSPGYHLRFQGGQFKAPQDVEELLEETELRFPTRSIVSDGQQVPVGYQASGLALGRQLGIAVGTDAVPLPFGAFELQVALMNGNGANQLVNDTALPSVSGRAGLKILSYAQLGFDAYYSPRGYGTQPNLFRDDLQGIGADLTVDVKPFHALFFLQKRTTHHLTSGAPDESALGYSVEGAARLWFIEPAIRYSFLDPNDTLTTAAVSELTVALNLYAPLAAARLSLAYTHRGQQPGRELHNDGLDLSAQVRF